MNRWIKCDIYIQCSTTQPPERRKFWYTLQHGWTFEDGVLRDRSQPPKKNKHCLTPVLWSTWSTCHLETESRMVVPRAGEGGRGGTWSIGAEFHFCEMKRVLWMDWADDNKAMWLYLIPVSWTQKWLWWRFLYYMYFTKIKKRKIQALQSLASANSRGANLSLWCPSHTARGQARRGPNGNHSKER